jgi:hypothetical protein
VAHRYGSKGNVSVDLEVVLKLMEQVRDHLIAAIQNVHILITHQTRLLIAPITSDRSTALGNTFVRPAQGKTVKPSVLASRLIRFSALWSCQPQYELPLWLLD